MEKINAEPRFQVVKRVVALVVCSMFLAWRASGYSVFWSKTLWALETLLYVVLVWNYLTRLPAVQAAAGTRNLVAPYFIAALPFAVFILPLNADALPRTFIPGQVLLLIGTTVTIAGMATLRRSFSISVEARAPVSRGLYRWVRHPVYIGEMLSLLGVALIRFSPMSLALAAAFIVLQTLRAGWEEETLAAAFPEYVAYRARTGAFFPRFR